jgi:GntR family transcriptional regulator, transcriptional repressor for pyruvate dehydrogenase complex
MAVRLSRPPLHKEVAEIISEKIIAGKFPANTYLPPERELCQSLGVSRTVVREAIKVLESRGLIQIKRGYGTLVTEPQHDHVTRSLALLLRRNGYVVNQLTEVRVLLEMGMAGLAAQRRTPENLSAMQRYLQTMKDKPGHPEGYVDADLAFHHEIARATQNPIFLILLEPFSDLLRQSRIASFRGAKVALRRSKEHERIFQMIKRQNVEGARSGMSKHLRATRADYDEARKTDSRSASQRLPNKVV